MAQRPRKKLAGRKYINIDRADLAVGRSPRNKLEITDSSRSAGWIIRNRITCRPWFMSDPEKIERPLCCEFLTSCP